MQQVFDEYRRVTWGNLGKGSRGVLHGGFWKPLPLSIQEAAYYRWCSSLHSTCNFQGSESKDLLVEVPALAYFVSYTSKISLLSAVHNNLFVITSRTPQFLSNATPPIKSYLARDSSIS
jgi:hypothetical protein